MKILKYALIAVAVLVLIVGALVAYVAATFDPNSYKPEIIRLVKEKQQRVLKLDGDIKIAFWPNIGADLGKLSLSEFKSDKEFAAVENMRVSLALMPLLSKQLVVNEVAIKGARVSLVRFKDGRLNIDDLLGNDEQKQQEQFKFDIDHVVLENAAFSFRDESKDAQYALSKVNLKTGRIANGVPAKVELSFAAQGNQPRHNVSADLKMRLTFDLDKQLYAFEDLSVETKGQIADISNLDAKASGSVTANLKTGDLTADKLAVALSGASGKDGFDVKLDAPKLNITAEKASGDKLTVVAKLTNPQGSTGISITLPGIEGTAEAFRAGSMAVELDMKQGDLTLKSKLSSPVSGNLQSQQLSLSRLVASVSASGPNIPGKSLSGEFAGSANVDGTKQNVQTNLTGRVGDSNIKAKLSVAGFTPPGINFDIDIDQLDLDRYMPQPAGSGKAAGGQKQAEQPFDLSGLRNLRANGALRIGSLKASGVKASNVRLEIKASGGRIDVSPLAANLYQGNMSGALAINAAQATPTFAVKQNLNGVSIGPLLRDLADQNMLEGRGNVTLDVTTQGNTVTALKKALNGSAAVKLADGELKGIDIAGTIRNAKAKLGALKGEQTQQSDTRQKTDFSELSATFNIRNSIARNNDLSMKSPLLRVGGEGDINIAGDSLNYLVKATIVGTSKGQGGRGVDDLKGITVPVRVSGPMAAPSYMLDFNALATEAVKQKAEEVIRGQLEKRLGGGAAKEGAKEAPKSSGDALKEGLKGLFGR
jgi:AsmA protein